MEPFGMDDDMKQGRFDETGLFIFNKRSRNRDDSDSDDSVEDPWLDSVRQEKESTSVLEQRAQRHAQVRIYDHRVLLL